MNDYVFIIRITIMSIVPENNSYKIMNTKLAYRMRIMFPITIRYIHIPVHCRCWWASRHELNLFFHIPGCFELICNLFFLSIFILILLVFGSCQLLSIGEIVDGNSEKDVEQSIVTKECKNDKIERVYHPRAMPTLRLDSMIHNFIPIFSSQNLKFCNPMTNNNWM